ncbi:hypothetical protein LCGC14_0093290 [marine sediment metagenome]|uniref:Uncharacterized protein n=1 Tax=marine sediment metagenome TaxID=412755 RepID=A0A0F9XWY0_9ZZZZ
MLGQSAVVLKSVKTIYALSPSQPTDQGKRYE